MTQNQHESVMRVARYQMHVIDLGHAFRVVVRIDRTMRPENAGAGLVTLGRVEQPFVIIAPVIDETTYAVALHELGHMIHPLGSLFTQCSKAYRDSIAAGQKQPADLRDVRLILESERNAWAWARQFALEWTPVMDGARTWAMQTYIKMARQVGLKETIE